MAKPITCPHCCQTDQVEKVSTIYLIGIGLNRVPSTEASQPEALIFNPELRRMPSASLKALSRRLAPPASHTQVPIRPIHPDLVVIAFSLITPIFLYGILTSQAAMLPFVLALLGGFYVFYFWRRKQMIANFERQQAMRAAANERIKQGIERWMKLYYCFRDDGVFEPKSAELVPADQISGYLFKE